MSATAGGEFAGKVLALCGGVGGAKLALGLSRVLPAGQLILGINTGDDFVHLGVHVAPDVDTVMYTLAGIENPETGWGRSAETWTFMEALEALGGETWFRLGDGDLATNLERTRRLAAGASLTAITADFATRLGIRARLLPMSDDPVRSMIETADGVLPFQHYFVKLRCAPVVRRISFVGAETARPNPVLLQALAAPDLAVVVICPSNPYLSIDPLLAMPSLRAALTNAKAPRIAVSPLIGGKAVKGPTAKIMAELGLPQTQAAIAQHYEGLIDGLVLDNADAAEATGLPCPVEVTRTLMKSLGDREALAACVLDFAGRLDRR